MELATYCMQDGANVRRSTRRVISNRRWHKNDSDAREALPDSIEQHGKGNSPNTKSKVRPLTSWIGQSHAAAPQKPAAKKKRVLVDAHGMAAAVEPENEYEREAGFMLTCGIYLSLLKPSPKHSLKGCSQFLAA